MCVCVCVCVCVCMCVCACTRMSIWVCMCLGKLRSTLLTFYGSCLRHSEYHRAEWVPGAAQCSRSPTSRAPSPPWRSPPQPAEPGCEYTSLCGALIKGFKSSARRGLRHGDRLNWMQRPVTPPRLLMVQGQRGQRRLYEYTLGQIYGGWRKI